VPQNGKFWLNIDFALRRKIPPGDNCRAQFPARQNFPPSANSAQCDGQILPLFRKVTREKSSKTKEKLVHAGTAQG
jgi:hypothetical protein